MQKLLNGVLPDGFVERATATQVERLRSLKTQLSTATAALGRAQAAWEACLAGVAAARGDSSTTGGGGGRVGGAGSGFAARVSAAGAAAVAETVSAREADVKAARVAVDDVVAKVAALAWGEF